MEAATEVEEVKMDNLRDKQGRFKKGNLGFWLGKKRSLETIKKMRLNGNHRPNKGSFKKGSMINLGRHPSLETKQKISNKLSYQPIRISRARVTTKNNKRVLRSHYVWCSQQENLPYIPKGFIIHHLDLNPINDISSNLLLMSKPDHTKFHTLVGEMIRQGRLEWPQLIQNQK